MQRRKFLIGSLATLAGTRLSAQSAGKVWRVGYLAGASVEANKPWLEAFDHELRRLGYRPGTNIVVDVRYIAGRFEDSEKLAAELAALKPDVLMVYGADAGHAAKKVAGTTPIVMANVQDPIASGLVSSLARPGGNVTGVADSHGASVTKRLELIKEALPAVSRVAVLWRPEQASHPLQIKDLQAAALKLGLTVIPVAVKTEHDIEPAFAAIKGERAGAVLLLGDALLTSHQRRIAALANANRIPSVYTIRTFAHAGGLMAYGTDFREQFRRAAGYVDRILRGAKPGDLPIVQPDKFELVINLKTAKAIGLTIPRALLARADQVIE